MLSDISCRVGFEGKTTHTLACYQKRYKHCLLPSMAAQATIGCLPSEVVQHIFCLLGSAESLVSGAQVCTQFLGNAEVVLQRFVLSRAQYYGYRGDDLHTAREYLDSLKVVVDDLSKRTSIGGIEDKSCLSEEHILWRECITGNGAVKEVNYLATLRKVCVPGSKNTSPKLRGTSVTWQTRLCLAIMRDEWDVMKVLLLMGTNPNYALAGEASTPFHYAVERGCIEALEVLLHHGALIDTQNYTGMTALHKAIGNFEHDTQESCERRVAFLLNAGANPNLCTQDMTTPLHSAASKCYDRVVQLLLQRGAAPDPVDVFGTTPVYRALKITDAIFFSEETILKTIIPLLEARANPNMVSAQTGSSPLHVAAAYRYSEVIKCLIKYGANTNKRDNIGNTALLRAVAYLRPCTEESILQVVQVLLEAGADPNLATHADDVAPLHLAAWFGYAKVVASLLRHGGVRVDAKNKAGETALHTAFTITNCVTTTLSKDSKELLYALRRPDKVAVVVKKLLGAGAHPNISSPATGMRPLHLAAMAGNAEAVRLLLQAGADPTHVNNDGQTAHALATTDAVRILL